MNFGGPGIDCSDPSIWKKIWWWIGDFCISLGNLIKRLKRKRRSAFNEDEVYIFRGIERIL